MAESISMDIRDDDIGSDKTHGTTDHFDHKVTQLEKCFLIANFILELPSAAFDQLSSVHKPQYALFSMLMSFAILIISIIDLVFKGQKGGVTLMIRRWIPWFYYPYPSFKPFGTFPDIVGLFCAMFQCIFTSLAYIFVSQQIDNPIKVSVWPIVFAFGLLYSRLTGNSQLKKSNPKVWRLTKAIEFTLAELSAATNDFLLQNKIAVGSSGVVYKAKLANGREVVVKRAGRGQERDLSEETLMAFESELEFLSRLHHKHLIGLIGYYEDENERVLVYEYMKKGSLYQLLHDKNINEKYGSVINSWKMRIKIALDAARGIEYLHSYAVPPVIHRAIKSSAILLDENWTARICEFAFSHSLKALEPELSCQSEKAVGTIGYIDPEYYGQKKLTAKSDVYSFGVVLLELLTGKPAVFKDDCDGRIAESVVDFAVPRVMSGEFITALDPRVSLPELSEAEAVELVAYTALHCVNLEGKQRPQMTDVVAHLERSFSLCDARDNN